MRHPTSALSDDIMSKLGWGAPSDRHVPWRRGVQRCLRRERPKTAWNPFGERALFPKLEFCNSRLGPCASIGKIRRASCISPCLETAALPSTTLIEVSRHQFEQTRAPCYRVTSADEIRRGAGSVFDLAESVPSEGKPHQAPGSHSPLHARF